MSFEQKLLSRITEKRWSVHWNVTKTNLSFWVLRLSENLILPFKPIVWFLIISVDGNRILWLLLSMWNQSFLMHFCVGPIDSLKVTCWRTFRCWCRHFNSIHVIVTLSLKYTRLDLYYMTWITITVWKKISPPNKKITL